MNQDQLINHAARAYLAAVDPQPVVAEYVRGNRDGTMAMLLRVLNHLTAAEVWALVKARAAELAR